MSENKHIGYINLGAYITDLRLSNSDNFHGVPLFSVRHWSRSLGVLLGPLEALMSCKPGCLSNGFKFDINNGEEVDTSRARYGAGQHEYCGFLIAGSITPEIFRLEKAIEDYHCSLGIDSWLSDFSRCGLKSESEKKAVQDHLVIYTDSKQTNIKVRLPKIRDMVNEPLHDKWSYQEQEYKSWDDVVSMVADSINEFIALALERTKTLISENYICAFNPLRDEVEADDEGDYSFKVLDSLSTGQFGLIVGEEGIGKTMLSLELALEVSNQKEQPSTVSNLFQVGKPGAVIGIFQEDDQKEIKQRCTNIGDRLGIKKSPYFGVMTHEDFDGSLTPSDRKEAILKYLRQAVAYKGAPGWRDPSLIIIDPIGLLIDGDESSAEPMKDLSDYLSMIARKYNCAVLGVHHPTKSAKLNPYGQGGTLDLNATAGHPILTRCARWVLNISRAKKGAIKLKVTKSNNGELSGDIHQLIKVNEKGEAFKSGECFAGFAIHKDESSESNFVEEVYKALLSIELSKHSKTKVIEDLCSTTSYSRNKIREAIDKLEGWGRIRSNRTAKGIQLEVVSNE